MNRVWNKSAFLVGGVLLTLFAVIGWQAVQADWVHRLLNKSKESVTVAPPGARSVPVSSTTQKPQLAERKAAFQKVVNFSSTGGTVASHPIDAALADVNEDGRLDLVTAFDNSLITVRRGTAEGAFGQATSFSVDAHIRALAVADVTGDGHLDVIIADAAEKLVILAGDGRGGFPQAQELALPGTPSRLLVKEFLGDERAEVLVAVDTGAERTILLWPDVAWLHPMPSSALQVTERRTLALPPERLPLPLQGSPSSLDIGFVDSNSYADIIGVDGQHIAVLFGDRTSPYRRFSTLSLERPALASAVGDFNGDARAEVAILDGQTHEVILYALTPKGEWNALERLPVGAVSALSVADINNDRVDDLVLIRPDDHQVSVVLGTRQGHLGGELVNRVRGRPELALPAYLDRDERSDLVVITHRGLSLLLSEETTQPLADVEDSPIIEIDPLELDVKIPEGECVTVPVTITIAPTVFRPLDIYLLVDGTNSFRDNIRKFAESGEDFVQALLDLRGDIRLGVGLFRDYPIQPFGNILDFAYRRVIDLQAVNVANRRRLIDAIRSIRTRGGGDLPEAQLPALFQAATGAGQEFPTPLRRANIPPDEQASFRRNVDVEKIIVLVTDSTFHEAGDPGQIPYPGPSFADTVAELNARGIKVIGINSGGGSTPVNDVMAALRRLAQATGTIAKRDIDCDGNGTIDIRKGEPIVCPPPADGVNLKDVILSVVRGFDLPVPLTLEIDRDCSPISFMIDPPVHFVDPLTGGTFTFNITFCCPCPSAPSVCRFETKVILDEIIRARIPSRVECVRPVCEVTPITLDFGDVCTGDSADRTITVRNTGNGAFTINGINSDNPAFTIVSPTLPVTVNPGDTVTVRVRFTCTTPGPQSGTISFVTDPATPCDSSEPLCAPVSVTGFCVNIDGDAAPRTIDFGQVCVGDSASQDFTVTNTGNRPFTIDAVNSSNPAFTVAPAGGVTIAPGDSATFTVTFTCTTSGPQSGTISFVTSNATNCPFDLGTIDVSGTCLLITCDVNPRTIDFGDVCVGDTADRTFTVSNTGNRPFTITGITSDNPAFSIVGPALPVTVPAGGSVDVTVRLTCTTPGPQSGTISFVTDSACGPVDCGT
ncbi:MAG: choice-of-anchor D domain-containing protein, partial [Acidobacteria bacterium]